MSLRDCIQCESTGIVSCNDISCGCDPLTCDTCEGTGQLAALLPGECAYCGERWGRGRCCAEALYDRADEAFERAGDR